MSNGDTASAEPRSRRNLDDELMGSVPIDPQFEGMNKADLASRVERAEALLAHQMEECRQLEHENDDLRGSKQLLEMEHRTALEDAAELTSRLDSLEHAFLTEQDGTVEGFGFAEHGNYGSNSDFFATERGTASRKSSAGSIKPRDPRAAAIARVRQVHTRWAGALQAIARGVRGGRRKPCGVLRTRRPALRHSRRGCYA